MAANPHRQRHDATRLVRGHDQCGGMHLTGDPPGRGYRHVPAPRALAAGSGPLPTTSANVSGLPEARTAQGILEQLGDAVDLVLDGGEAHGGPASTVVDCSVEQALILRAGAIPPERIAAILDAAGVPHAIDAEPDRGARIG